MWLSLDRRVYRKLHNIIIPGSDGTAQIDHLLISPYGIFIVETKNISGKIYGDANAATWTSVLRGKKYPFQNPLRQAYRQKMVLSERLVVDPALIHTIAYFVSDCKFKTKMPDNVRRFGIGSYIKRFQTPILSEEDVNAIAEYLGRHQATSTITHKQHVKSLHQRHKAKKRSSFLYSLLANPSTRCPECGKRLVKKTAQRGRNAGSRFWGCTGFPKCKFTRDI